MGINAAEVEVVVKAEEGKSAPGEGSAKVARIEVEEVRISCGVQMLLEVPSLVCRL